VKGCIKQKTLIPYSLGQELKSPAVPPGIDVKTPTPSHTNICRYCLRSIFSVAPTRIIKDNSFSLPSGGHSTKRIQSAITPSANLSSATSKPTILHQRFVKLDKYPEAYKQVPDFKTWIKEHMTTDNKKLYVVTGSLYFISQVRKWVLEQESDG